MTTKLFTFKVTDTFLKQLTEVAEERGVTTTSIMKEALALWLAQNDIQLAGPIDKRAYHLRKPRSDYEAKAQARTAQAA